MVAPGGFVPGSARVEHFHRIVVHFVVDAAGEAVGGDEGVAVAVGRRGAVRGEGDFQADDGFAGAVEEGVLVEGGEG